ncbi:MAG TPA: ribonuclease E/G, partial [Rhodospirillales bacterium]|nr:ribonuclease E/G [Rhodospirillales bacterium]
MSIKQMLIDATHPEETRVVVMNGNRLEDFDVESSSRKQLKGNIYLAKVIRVEPSLQAAFVDYGGNRHGFLAFSEIHPDYYQVPIEDRQALLEEYKAAEISEDSAEVEPDDASDEAPESEAAEEQGESDTDDDAGEGEESGIDDHRNVETANKAKGVETLGGDDTDEARPPRKHLNYRRYKIQEVVKRRQIILVQVVKEERGNKGAALTTYISLAGRYCVLMPNTARGGGISRKITNGADRKQLKAILSELEIPDGMAVIVRTAGIKRSRSEIKRDYEYLMRLWDSVRELTLNSMAPSLVHEEGNLIKRSIRDLYSRDVEDIVVAGDAGYRMAKDFIKLLIPSHAKRVQPYKEVTMPMFRHFQVESQLDAIHSPEVHMKSGSYIVINPTEALVSIDVNSGRSTRERNIEETALKTNLEAADEIARQLRLRDLAGLIVIDFIDMEVNRNNGLVERRLKDAMRNDRARIQIGRISPFGLLELSRQRLRMSLIETSSEPCQYCGGTGIRRSTDSSALVALRAIEEEANRKQASEFVVHVPTAIALYILNQKRSALSEIETRCEISINVAADDALVPPDLRLERIRGDVREEVAREAGSMIVEGDEKPGKRRRRRSRNRKSADGENAPQNDQNGDNVTSESQHIRAGKSDDEGEE